MYYQETPNAKDVTVTIDNLVCLGEGPDLFEESKGFFDRVGIYRSEFEAMDLSSLMRLETEIDAYVMKLGPAYSVEQSDGSFWRFEPRSEITKSTVIKTYGLDKPIVSGATEMDNLYLRRCRVKGRLQHRKDGKVNLAIDYVDFYPEEEREPIDPNEPGCDLF